MNFAKFDLKDFIMKQYNEGREGFGVSIEGDEFEEAEQILKAAGIRFEVEPDNPAEMWIQFVRDNK